MASILREFKPQMNGAVVGAMEQRGIVYPLNYGVSVPTIRSIAARYAPNHKLATLLYRQQIRELILASFTIADTAEINSSNVDFWANGIVNSEVAEHLGTTLISRLDCCQTIGEQWLRSDNPNVVYAGLIALAKGITNGKATDLTSISKLSEHLLSSSDHLILRGLELLYVAIARSGPQGHSIVDNMIVKISATATESERRLIEEIIWQI